MIQLQTHVCLVTSTLCGVIQQRFEVIALYDQIHYDCGDGTGKLRCCWQSLLVRQQNSLDIVTWFVWQWLPTSLKHFLTVCVRFLGTDIHTKTCQYFYVIISIEQVWFCPIQHWPHMIRRCQLPQLQSLGIVIWRLCMYHGWHLTW